MIRPALLACVLLLAPAVPGPGAASSAQAADSRLAAAVNKAGRQRMLTQRIVKLHAQIAMNVAAGEARALLDESLEQLSRQAAELEPYARTPAAIDALGRLARARARLRGLALAPPDKARALGLNTAADDCLAAADEVVRLLESEARLVWLVNVAGRQRMVSQRLAKLYMLRAWGVTGPELAAQADSASAEFADSLGRLLRTPQNTPEIDRELYALAVQWEWFRNALALEGVAGYMLVVADASEAMLRSLERIVSLYEAAAR